MVPVQLVDKETCPRAKVEMNDIKILLLVNTTSLMTQDSCSSIQLMVS